MSLLQTTVIIQSLHFHNVSTWCHSILLKFWAVTIKVNFIVWFPNVGAGTNTRVLYINFIGLIFPTAGTLNPILEYPQSWSSLLQPLQLSSRYNLTHQYIRKALGNGRWKRIKTSTCPESTCLPTINAWLWFTFLHSRRSDFSCLLKWTLKVWLNHHYNLQR